MKTNQLQIRVTDEQKRRLHDAAAREGTSVTEYVLSRALPNERIDFEDIVERVSHKETRSYALADLSDFLERLSPAQLTVAVAECPPLPEDAIWANVVAAMVETALHRKHAKRPKWLSGIAPLSDPWFATNLKSLRLYLLCVSPPPFRRRNLFVDSTLGDRV